MCSWCRQLNISFIIVFSAFQLCCGQSDKPVSKWPKHIQTVLDNTKPLKYSRGQRLPLYLWQAIGPGQLTDKDAELLVEQLNSRGIGLVCSWLPNKRQQCLSKCLPIARAQKKLGLRININANACLYSFFNGDEKTAHIDSAGKPFWDKSFGSKKMGCPFAIDHRRQVIRERVEWYADKYAQADLPVDFVFADWEVDGPIEWNGAWENSKKCQRCRQNIPQIDTNFMQFQKILRDIRSDLQRDVYAEPLRCRFPNVLVGNYAVYPHNGFRYWYDYFEKYINGQPALIEGKAHYRHWANEFEKSGYTFAMPTVYPWSWTWNWYDFDSGDYRWFYNMLKVASNAARYTSSNIPIITFVHWHTVMVGTEKDKTPVRQFSEQNYQELLWHMLLRGHDTFFLWCRYEESPREIRLLHQVWADAQQYGDFLEKGRPICFDVPSQPATVISGLQMGTKVLVRRTDFVENSRPVKITAGSLNLVVPPGSGQCRVLGLNR